MRRALTGVDQDESRRLTERLQALALQLEKLRIDDYVELLEKPRRFFVLNFLAGLYRGFGLILGTALMGAVVLFILQRLFLLNLPLIGSVIADLIRIVQKELLVR